MCVHAPCRLANDLSSVLTLVCPHSYVLTPTIPARKEAVANKAEQKPGEEVKILNNVAQL